MGRKNKSYYKDIKQQMYDCLTGMLHAGEGTSKKEAILDGTDKDKIFSYNTFKTYKQHCKYFADYIKREHPECTTLRAARKYVHEWLQSRVDYIKPDGKHLSAWTIQTEAKALGKLYKIQPDSPDYFVAPKRKRQDIKRSRQDVSTDRHFSVTNNDLLIKFCQGTGCRRNVLSRLKGQDLWTKEEIEKDISRLKNAYYLNEPEKKTLKALEDAIEQFPDQLYFIHHRGDKGGRERYAPVIGKNTDKIIEKMQSVKPDERVWKYVPKNADIHGYRAEYATGIYRMYARPINKIPYDRVNGGTGKRFQSDVYVCRKDAAGKKLDKAAMRKASKALGHNRIEIVANNYIRGI